MEEIEIQEFKSYPGLLDTIKEYSNKRKFLSGEIIFNENKNIREIPIVLSGSLKVTRTEEDGKEILLYYIKKGESCVMSFFGSVQQCLSKVKASVEEDAEILFLPLNKLDELKNHSQWLPYIFNLYHKRFEELLEVINDIAFKKVDQRLLDLIHKKQQLTGEKEIKITHEQLANELGTARVVVSRLLKQLEIEGILKLSRNKIIVV